MPAGKPAARTPSGLPHKKWTTEANVELLLTIIQTYNVKINYAEIAAKLGGVTAEAVKKHFFKLKGGRKDKVEKELGGKKFEIDWKEESSDDEVFQGKKIKVER